MKRIMLVLTVALVMVAMVLLMTGSALAKQGPNAGNGDQWGGGNVLNSDNGQQNANGGGQTNNKHFDDCGVICEPL